jgi:hypothetical protein
MRSPYAYVTSGGAGGVWTDLTLSTSSAGQDPNSVIDSVTDSTIVVANGASAAGSPSDVGVRYWSAAGVIDGAGFLLIELELSADVPEAGAIGVGLAIDGDNVNGSASCWTGLKEQAAGSSTLGWSKFSGSISSSGSDRTDRVLGLLAVTDSSGNVDVIMEYRRDASDNGIGPFTNPSTNASATGAMAEFIVAVSRSGDAGSNQTVQISGIRYQFVKAD